ncbi:hypothetical protein FH972_016887 [Carpinus fangiana]|uniref:F-box associated domain-containing protein n=1 Tax=Carpinus fangiana TaxID=176857 RepID=A0A5N6RII0_9ROSI|nr:hypothetical protein FH972_016887 [Carpinus fangiana]
MRQLWPRPNLAHSTDFGNSPNPKIPNLFFVSGPYISTRPPSSQALCEFVFSIPMPIPFLSWLFRSWSFPTPSSIADPSPSGTARNFCPRTCEIAICMPVFHESVMTGRWYVIPIGVDAGGMFIREERTIKPFWEGHHTFDFSFAALGSTIYCFGPDDSVFKLDAIGPMTDGWIHAPSMNTRRNQPHKLVLGSKLYVLGSDRRDLDFYAEVFDPVINKWVVLPEPPYKMSYFIISAALENPNRILVASKLPQAPSEGCSYDNLSAVFFVYDVGHGDWKTLEPAQRKIHRSCPFGLFGIAQAVGNFLYWITKDLGVALL